MTNISVATTVTEVLPALVAGNRNGQTITLQNQSDTNIFVAIGAANVAQLTSSLGIRLEPGDSMPIYGDSANQPISAIHGGSGSKTLLVHIV